MLSTLINLLCLLTPLILAQDDDTLEPIDRTLPKVITDWDTEPDAELPSSLLICRKNDPNRDGCIKKSIQDLLPLIADGFPTLGIEPLDPYIVGRAFFEFKRNNISGALVVKNAKVFGATKAKIQDVRSKLTDKEMTMEIDIFFPKLIMEGNYRGEGSFSTYRVKSKGFFNVTQYAVYVTMQMQGELENRNGDEYMQITSFDFEQPVVKSMKIFATGLFPDPNLNQLAIDFMNQYWPFVYQQLLPETKKSWEPIMVNAVNQVFGRIPFRRLMILD